MPITKERLQHLVVAANEYALALEDTLAEIDNLLLDYHRHGRRNAGPLIDAIGTIQARHPVAPHAVQILAIEGDYQRRTSARNGRKAIKAQASRDRRQEALKDWVTSRPPIVKEAHAALSAALGPIPAD